MPLPGVTARVAIGIVCVLACIFPAVSLQGRKVPVGSRTSLTAQVSQPYPSRHLESCKLLTVEH